MIWKIVAYLRGFLLKGKIQTLGPIKSIGKTIIDNKEGLIRIGRRSCLWPEVKFTLTRCDGFDRPVLEIGSFTSLGDRTQIHCGWRVTIGENVLISWDVNIIEYEYHAPGGGQPTPRKITIEDEVWIGARSMILNGVTIGRGAIVGAGAVVTKDVDPFMLVAGNPARVIQQVSSWTGSKADTAPDSGTGNQDEVAAD